MRPCSHTLTFAIVFLIGHSAAAGDNKPPEGFTALFNGKDLAGWQGLVGDPPKRASMTPADLAAAQSIANERMRAHWSVVNGVLEFDGEGDNLCTVKNYANFELLVDWKVESKGDSGIYLRGSPQVQIWDPHDQKEASVGSGGLYNNEKGPNKPLFVADKALGKWNSFRIRMIGENVTVWLNGKRVVDNVKLENYWERDKPIYPTGAIELQNHETRLHFKNIYIKELSQESS